MKTVLFVCVHNAGRSQMAEALLNKIAAERCQPIRAVSAGTVPGERINPIADAVMAEIGLPMTGRKPRQLTQEMADSADRIITIGCGVEDACHARIQITEDWGLDDPKDQPLDKVRQIRNQIQERVEALLDEMGETTCRTD